MKYKPSNSCVAERVMEKFCYQCKRDEKFQITQDGEDSCPIARDTILYEEDDPEYPSEWTVIGGKPVCTAFDPIISEDGE